mmetsp:Transcript_285/g.629  ORF Transcript_285/g.629 Transcript_285/m.629 type:complete len:165 (+) Transcript_285:1-495(+)|eukprot:CAMPEP_0119073350 /NCGR_PEP_ID=MMETSP1178-20130426/64406_1 /TAXON_ID=33656 /ORGANISM="unid sp, Strain CCMP2000" /LENGTH=164 /DNA_ID=CAMNT_0007055421 /DNA_START=1 /DNA_END=495 /DNA_ORIENTATION=+
MGFGKRKNAVGMARPKKSKVVAREEEAVMRASGAMTASKDIGAGIKRKEPSGRISHKLQAAEAELEELHFQFLAAQRVAKVFKDKLQLEKRLNDAKMRRVDAAQKKKPRGSAILQLERLYQAEEQLLRAQLAASETESECHRAEADWLAQQCCVLRLEMATRSQ